jgi:hypothetical protein
MRKRIALLGNPLRCEAYRLAFTAFLDPDLDCIELEADSMDTTAIHGALRLAALRGNPEVAR